MNISPGYLFHVKIITEKKLKKNVFTHQKILNSNIHIYEK